MVAWPPSFVVLGWAHEVDWQSCFTTESVTVLSLRFSIEIFHFFIEFLLSHYLSIEISTFSLLFIEISTVTLLFH